ncbi:hypothetical protein NLI96_g930 [Meripilus lineatus]|uniref:F-box domain-containing protein n=1 Tax=Meripilus lineatus TaxID=2056292 RepID=A0AAD5VH18_9APHY|nr:hypothetical protein NLI96_g930 [Physisporinus lineatus]
MTTLTSDSHLAHARATLITKVEESQAVRDSEERSIDSGAVRVPPEILADVFLYVIDDVYEGDLEPIQQLYLPHVCRYWYNVTLQSTQYWRYQPLSRDGRLRASRLIERAGGRSLYVWGRLSADNHPRWDSPKRDSILLQAELVKITLCREADDHPHADNSDPVVPGFLEAFLQRSAPHLEALSLSARDMLQWPTIPEVAFDGDTPLLRSLTLRGLRWSWLTAIFVSSLTGLILHGPVHWDDDCIRTLQRLPSLRRLELINTTRPAWCGLTNIAHSASPSVKLKHLEVLHLGGHVYNLGALALELDTPPSTSITISSYYAKFLDNDPTYFAPLLSWLSKRLQYLDAAFVPIRAMHVTSWSTNPCDGTLRLYLSDPILNPYQLPQAEDDDPCLKLKVHFKSFCKRSTHRAFLSFNAILHMITSKLLLSPVQTLYLDHTSPLRDIRIPLNSLTGVQTFCLSGRDSPAVLRDLLLVSPNISHSRGEDSKGDLRLLPAIKTVILHGANFEQGSEDIVAFVASRSKQGRPVEKLYLSQCEHVLGEWLQTLRRYVSMVEWDGLEGVQFEDYGWMTCPEEVRLSSLWGYM